jgi:hypothetical protein
VDSPGTPLKIFTANYVNLKTHKKIKPLKGARKYDKNVMKYPS